MSQFPAAIEKIAFDYLYRKRPLACLELDLDGRILAQHGDFGEFGIEGLAIGVEAEQVLDFLTGLLAVESLPLDLDFVQMPSGISSDLHLFSEQQRIWVLLVGVE